MSVVGTLLISGAVAVFCDKKIEECYAVVAMILSWILYIPGLYFSLVPGIIFYYISFFISIVYLLFAFRNRREDLKKYIFTYGALFLLLCIAVFGFYSVGRGIDHSDDFYFWNLRIKNMVYFGKMKGVPNTALGDHPPFTALWDYLAVMTWSGKVSQGICLWGQNVLMMSFVAPLFSLIDGKFKVVKTLLVSGILFLIPTITSDAYHTLLADLMLGVIIFFCFYTFCLSCWNSDRFSALCFVLSMISLTMTKRTGSVFMAIILLIGFQCENACTHKRVLLLAGLGSSAALYSWNGNDNSFYIAVLATCAALIIGVASGYIRNILGNRKGNCLFFFVVSLILVFAADYIYVCLDDNLIFGKHVWEQISKYPNPSFLESIIDFFVINALLIWANREKIKAKIRIEIIRVAASYLIGVIGYCILMWYLEAVEIGPANGGVGGLSVRYFIPLLIPLYIVTIILLLKFNNTCDISCLIGMILLAHAYSDSEMTIYNLLNKKQPVEFYEFSKNEIVLTPQDHVYLIDEKDDYVYTDRAFYNYICPARSQFGTEYNYLVNGSEGVMTYTVDEFENFLKSGGFNYVYVQLITEETAERYSCLFQESSDIRGGRLYAVRYDGEELHLEWIHHDQ